MSGRGLDIVKLSPESQKSTSRHHARIVWNVHNVTSRKRQTGNYRRRLTAVQNHRHNTSFILFFVIRTIWNGGSFDVEIFHHRFSAIRRPRGWIAQPLRCSNRCSRAESTTDAERSARPELRAGQLGRSPGWDLHLGACVGPDCAARCKRARDLERGRQRNSSGERTLIVQRPTERRRRVHAWRCPSPRLGQPIRQYQLDFASSKVLNGQQRVPSRRKRIGFVAQPRHQYVRIIWNAYTVAGQKPQTGNHSRRLTPIQNHRHSTSPPFLVAVHSPCASAWRCTRRTTAHVRAPRCTQSRTRRAHIAGRVYVENAYFQEFGSTSPGHCTTTSPHHRSPA